MRLLLYALFILTCSSAFAYEGPTISIYQGTEKGTSVIEVVWPDGVVERLKYKNKDAGGKGYLNWFNARMDAYEKRTGK